MTPMRHPADGRVHFSELKQHARSPAHVKLACETARDVTRAMIVGGVADSIVFGQRGYTLYDGTRRGDKWEAFKAAHPGQYLPIQSELDDARGAAAAALADQVASDLLRASDYQVGSQREAYGLPFAAVIPGDRRGVHPLFVRTTHSLLPPQLLGTQEH